MVQEREEEAFISQMVLNDDAASDAIQSRSKWNLANWPVDANGKASKSKMLGNCLSITRFWFSY
jgi:hypothetical protein